MINTVKLKFPLSPALDPQWLKENLPRYLWREHENPGEIFDFDILHIWESSKGVVVLYQVGLHDPQRRLLQQLYVGHVLPADRLSEEFRSALKKAKTQPAFGRAVALVPEANLMMLAFPNDRKMRLLSEAMLQAWLPENLRRVADGALEGRSWQVQETKVEMLRYVPNKRFTAHCRVKLQAEDGLQKEISFIAKQQHDEKKAKRSYRSLVALRSAWAGTGKKARRSTIAPPIRLPKALAFDENRAVVFLEYMPGKNLKQALFEIDIEQVMPKVGALLAHFHRAQKRVRKQVTLRNEQAEVREAVRAIAKTFPALRPRLRHFYAQLGSSQWIDAAKPVLLHGTYRLNHIFIHQGELALFDLDSLRMGHPAYDIANFLSSLYYLEAQERIEPALRKNIARHFLAGYAAHAPCDIAPPAVFWFLSSLLINKQAGKYVAHFHDDREEKVNRMLALAEAALALCRQAPDDLTFTALWKVLP